MVNNNLGGLENLSGIPGTLGGAIVQNAGCYNTLISDYLEEVTCIINNEIKTCFGKPLRKYSLKNILTNEENNK